MTSLDSNVVAVLGPTNTGKTHRAIERMLEFRSGVMGFPLRLLAREVYDRICAQVGASSVALVTGEEREVPKHARYWICTVEAMPEALDVDFVAVDEIQLATDRERGHVFTQRLLGMRGRAETWFLGASTMQGLIRAVIPHARIEHRTRLSTLRYAGTVSLSGLPKRTAVVALSRRELYPIAEHIRQRKGGVALVLGALSPRARNAQVELFESGDVDYLVATDAIGMGLNLDLQHVVFASVSKFDGQRRRRLATDELAQIAGRAGRHLRDGSFYTLHNGPQLEDSTIRDIEAHRFRAKTRLVWRNDALDFGSLQALVQSLRAEAPSNRYVKLQRADDFEALVWMSQRAAVREQIRDAHDLRRLWTVCRIPDYRKLLLDRHFLLLEEIFLQLSQRKGQLDPDWMQTKLKGVDRVDGGIELLMTRLAFIRTWSYVTHRPDWLQDAPQWQSLARAIEERVSQALHDALTIRFLHSPAPNAGRAGWTRKPRPSPRRHTERTQASDRVPDADHPFAQLASWNDITPASEASTHWLERWLAGDDRAMAFDETQGITWDRHPVAQMGRGSQLMRPEISLSASVDEQVNVRERALLLRRVHAFVQGHVDAELLNGGVPRERARALTDAGRALLYALRLNAGVTPWSELPCAWRRGCHHELEGLQEGWLYLYFESALQPRGQAMRERLLLAAQGDGKLEMPMWVRGVHRQAGHEQGIHALEADLAKALGHPRAALRQRVRPDSGPGDAWSARSWYGLLQRLGWSRDDTGHLRYEPARDRNRAPKPARRKRRR